MTELLDSKIFLNTMIASSATTDLLEAIREASQSTPAEDIAKWKLHSRNEGLLYRGECLYVP